MQVSPCRASAQSPAACPTAPATVAVSSLPRAAREGPCGAPGCLAGAASLLGSVAWCGAVACFHRTWAVGSRPPSSFPAASRGADGPSTEEQAQPQSTPWEAGGFERPPPAAAPCPRLLHSAGSQLGHGCVPFELHRPTNKTCSASFTDPCPANTACDTDEMGRRLAYKACDANEMATATPEETTAASEEISAAP